MIVLEPNPVLPVQRVHVFPRSGNVWLNGGLLPSSVVIDDDGFVTSSINMREIDRTLRDMVLRPDTPKAVLYIFNNAKRGTSKRFEYTPGRVESTPNEGVI